jgi:hypothetical protein
MKTNSKQPVSLFERLTTILEKADHKIDQYIAHFIEQIEEIYQ